MKIFDSHTHLQWDLEKDPVENRLARARLAGVEKLLCVGIDIESSLLAASIAQQHDGVYASAGLHPNDISSDRKQLDIQLSEIHQLLKTPNFIAVGESGLDFFRDRSAPEDQVYSFNKHLEFSSELTLPIIIHCREALHETLECLQQHCGPINGVMHCWPGTPELVHEFVALGLHISFAGNATYKQNQQLRESIAEVPLDRLLVETDAPFLSPQKKRGQRNESAFIIHTLEFLAEQRPESLETVAQACWDNAQELFQTN